MNKVESLLESTVVKSCSLTRWEESGISARCWVAFLKSL